MKKCHFGEKLQSRRLILVLRKTGIIVREEPFLTRPFSKSTVRISKFFREIMKGISKFIFSVMFYVAENFNNSRALKNAFLELSYNPGSYKDVN